MLAGEVKPSFWGEEFSMGQEIPEVKADETSVNTSTNHTPLQCDALVPVGEDKQPVALEGINGERGVQSRKRRAGGPHSEAGKMRSSRNSFKFGIFAKVILVPGESNARYRSLLKSIREDWQPEGVTEEALSDLIANTLWRFRRIYAAEGAEIRRGREFMTWDDQNRQNAEAEIIGTKSGDGSDLLDPEPGLIWKIRNPVIAGRCLQLLLEFEREIKAGSFKQNRDIAILRTIYGPNKHLRKTLYQSYVEWPETTKPEGESHPQGLANEKAFKKYFLSEIAREIRRLRDYQREHASVESERVQVEALRCNVPGSERCEHLLKYESTLLRELDRLMNLLEHRQRLRSGEPVAPIVDINLRA